MFVFNDTATTEIYTLSLHDALPICIKDGRICAIGKAGNPQTMDRITPGLEVGLATDAISGSHLILTAGGVDSHIHFISPQQAQAALSNGTTTLIGGGTGPSGGSKATTVPSGPGKRTEKRRV